MSARKTIRILEASLALVMLLVFATVLVSGWHHHNSANESQCRYCHLDHQTAGQPETSQRVAVLSLVDSLPHPEDSGLAASPFSFRAASRAPPLA